MTHAIPPLETRLGRVALSGSTGLVGAELMRLLLARTDTEALVVAGRRGPRQTDARLHFVSWSQGQPDLPELDHAFCALGTTIKAAGSQAAFRAVDFDLVVAFARAAKAAGARALGVVSALGADPSSSIFYNSVKGETEDALRGLNFERLVIARPSLLLGDRAALGQPVRPVEGFFRKATPWVGRLIPSAWRPIEAGVVANALLHATARTSPAVEVLESAALQQLAE